MKNIESEEDWLTSQRAETMSTLKNFEELWRFNPRILSADQEFDSDEELPCVDCELLYLFNSESYDERFEAFCLAIKEPLFNVLRVISEAFGALTSESLQHFECFNSTAVTNAYPDLMNVAIKDIFESGQLVTFRTALKDLETSPTPDITKLKKCDVWKLANFYHGYAKLLMAIEMDQHDGESFSEPLAKLKSDMTIDSRNCHEIWACIKQPRRERCEKEHEKLLRTIAILSNMEDGSSSTVNWRQILRTYYSNEVDEPANMCSTPSHMSTLVIACNRQFEICPPNLLEMLSALDDTSSMGSVFTPVRSHQNICIFIAILNFLMSTSSIEKGTELEVLRLLQRSILHDNDTHQPSESTILQSRAYRTILKLAFLIHHAARKPGRIILSRPDREKTIVPYEPCIRNMLHVSKMKTFFSSESVKVEDLHNKGYIISWYNSFGNEIQMPYYDFKTTASSQQSFSKARLK